MANDLVSVVVAATGRMGRLGECLQSLHAQSHERLELVVVGNPASDEVFEEATVLSEMPSIARYENIVVRRTASSSGMHDLWNAGLALAKGNCVALVAAGDVFHPRRVARLLAALEDSGTELAFSSIEPLPSFGPGSEIALATEVPLPEEWLLPGLRQQLSIARDPTVGFALLRQDVALCPGNMLMTASLARRVDGFQPFARHHGWDFLLQSLLHTEPVFVPEPLYARRLNFSDECYEERKSADVERDAVLRRYFTAALSRPATNRLCPGPAQWPGYFEGFVWAAGHGEPWRAASGTVGGTAVRGDGVSRASPSTPTILSRMTES